VQVTIIYPFIKRRSYYIVQTQQLVNFIAKLKADEKIDRSTSLIAHNGICTE
jgi:hypothetical protein